MRRLGRPDATTVRPAARTTPAREPDPYPWPMIKTGDQAPDFELPDHDGTPVRLSSLRGRPIVLYFYPKADTPGCTAQACGIRDHSGDYEAAGVTVLGVSPDPVSAIAKFHDKQDSTSRCSPTRTTPSPRSTASGARRRCTARRTWA